MNNKNAEGYPDPTAAVALARVAKEEKKYRPLIYVCSPYSGDIEHNISRARGYCRYVISKGGIPIASHLLFPQFLDEMDREERELGLSFALILVCKCHEIWVFGDRVSEGMAREIKKAKDWGIPVRFFNGLCKGVS